MSSTLTPNPGSAPLSSAAPGYDGESADAALASGNYVPAVPARGFRVGTTAGNVTVVTAAGNSVTIPSVQIGETIAISFTSIVKATTTAAGITAFS